MKQIYLYDTTLRDGAQREGISFSLADKLHITQKLDELGIHYIEGGWPGSNPKDAEFFSKVKEMRLAQAKVVSFGSTRHSKNKVEEDDNLRALVDAGMEIIALVGKSSAPQVAHVLETSLEDNLIMIADSVSYLRSKGFTVFYDAEHFFDGYKADANYALRTLAIAADAGAGCMVLCDTNGGCLPEEIAAAVKAAVKATAVPVAIHAHNDSDLAVANSLAAVQAGAVQVQGTINGYGERCGNANLCSVIANLKLKMGIDCVTDTQLAKLTETAHSISEIANLAPDAFAAYTGSSAFSHKGGFHVSAITKWESAYQHIDPAKVGNRIRVVVSELSGKKNIIYKAKEMGFDMPAKGKEAQKLLDQVKALESRGFQYENAEASFELLVHRSMPGYRPPFEMVDFMVLVESKRRAPTHRSMEETLSEATVKIKVDGEIRHTVAEGNGPVNALDAALRQALVQFYPDVAQVKLIDYKVRILEESTGTGSQVRVLIESGDGADEWRTVGSSANIIEASWLALADSLEYWLIKHSKR